MKRIDLTGRKFGRLCVLEYVKTEKNRAYWLCKCECGNEIIIMGRSLKTLHTQSCGCLQKERTRKRLLNNTYSRIEKFEASKNKLYRSYKYNAQRRDIEFALTKQEFLLLTAQNCFYCGEKPRQERNDVSYNGNYVYNGIDRVDNSIGYTLENCVSCCKMCNFSKNCHDKNTFLSWISKVYKHSIEDKELL